MTPARNAVALASLATAMAVAPDALAVVRVTLQVVPPRPVAGQPFHLLYGLQVQDDGMADAQPLRFPGLQVLANAQPPTTRNMMVFGGGFGGVGTFTVQTQAEYILVAPRAGRYTVSGARAVSPQTGRVVAQHPDLAIDVLPAGAAPPAQAQAPAPGMMMPGFPPGFPFPPGMMAPDAPPPQQTVNDPDAPPLGEIPSALFDPAGFVRVAVDDPTPYVGQQTTLRAWLYVPSTEVACDAQREPQLTGFWNEQLIDRGQVRCARGFYQQVVGGRQMAAGLMRKVALFPTRPGRQEIGPMEVVAEYIEGDGFFGQRRRITVQSPALVVDVRDLPEEGRPPGYVPGLLGPLQITAELDRPRVATGETATLRVRAQGNGYLGAVGLPAPPPVEGVRMHAGASRHEVDRSDESRVRGNLVAEYLLVPERPGEHRLGVLNVPWFDPGEGRYHVATVALPALTAEGAPPERDADERREDPALALDPLRESPSLTPHRPFFTSAARAWGAIALPPALLALAGLSRALRRWRARRAEALAEVERNDPGALLARCERALAAGDAAQALDLAGRALERARKEYGTAGLDDAGRAAVAEAQSASDTLRFGGAPDPTSARDLLGKVRGAVRAMEKAS